MSQQDGIYEQVLLEKLKCDDKTAFSILFSRYYRDLVTFAVTITHEHDVSEEIVQDVFMKLWESRRSLEIQSSLKSYLLRSVQNKCIDNIRHREIEQKYSVMYRMSPVLFTKDTENYLLHSELDHNFRVALGKIPSLYADVFRMSRMEGRNYKDIASKLGVSERTIEVRMSKALHLLREELKDFLS
jgi:RNA polymerase sigma-70 factor (family 1)